MTAPLLIGCAAGFSGDRADAAGPVVDTLARLGQPSVLMFETLAERTLALAQLARRTNPEGGYEPLLDDMLRPVLGKCLALAGARSKSLDTAFQDSARSNLANDTTEAFARGIFGVPTFVFDGEIFFGSDRLELLLWSIEQRLSR